MFATVASIALLASTPAEALARPAIATPSEAASAVASCVKATGPGAVDHKRLGADGWQGKSGEPSRGNVLTHQSNAAVLLTLDAPLSGTCYVRVRLADAASIEAAGHEIDRLLGVEGKRRLGEVGKFFWRTSSGIVASEGFDDGPGSPPYVIQIAIGAWPKESK